MQHPYLVGITGGSASGKTTFLKRLLAAFPESDICLISQDNYYHPFHLQVTDEQGVTNFDLPGSIDSAAYAHDVQRLREGHEVRRPEYTFNAPGAVSRELVLRPAPIVVVEGIFVFYFEEIAKLLDLKVFIDAQEHVKLHRRIVRDQIERGLTLDTILYQYSNHVSPTYDKYIKPFRGDADIIIPNNKHFETGLDVLIGYLRGRVGTTA